MKKTFKNINQIQRKITGRNKMIKCLSDQEKPNGVVRKARRNAK